MVINGVISEKECDNYLCSIETVASNINNDYFNLLNDVSRGEGIFLSAIRPKRNREGYKCV